jgi:thioesterase-3
MSFSTDLKVRGFHIDVFGHMNNARYLELMEEARWQYVEATRFGALLKAKNWGFAVVNINISYKKPAFAGNVLTFKIDVTRMGNSSMTLQQSIYLKGTDTLIAQADVTFVVLNLVNNKPVRITDDLKEAFTINETA